MAAGKTPEKGRELGQPRAQGKVLRRLYIFMLILVSGILGHYIPLLWPRFEEPIDSIRFIQSFPVISVSRFRKELTSSVTSHGDEDVEFPTDGTEFSTMSAENTSEVYLAASDVKLSDDHSSEGEDGDAEKNTRPLPRGLDETLLRSSVVDRIPREGSDEQLAAADSSQESLTEASISQVAGSAGASEGRTNGGQEQSVWRRSKQEAHRQRLAANMQNRKANRKLELRWKPFQAILAARAAQFASKMDATSQNMTAGNAGGNPQPAANDRRETGWVEPKRVDKEWQTPYVVEEVIDVANEPLCKQFYPAHVVNNSDTRPINRIHHLNRPGTRALVFVPRFGLGNTLRGYVSSFIYAVLSGRRLVRLHGGDHTKVYDSLCEAFSCGHDAIHWEDYGHPEVVWRHLNKLRPFFLLPKLRSAGILKTFGYRCPLIAIQLGSYIDGYWMNNEALNKCVYAAFKCKGPNNLWCIYSRALHALLKGGPTQNLDDTMAEILERQVPNKMVPQPLHSVPMGVDLIFDVAIHLRTRTPRIESIASCRSTACQESHAAKIRANDKKYTNKYLWSCIGLAIKALDRFLPSRNRSLEEGGFSIFLATDNEQLRPSFVQKLLKYGTVHYSVGKVVHTSKSIGFASRLPTMAEFYLMSKAHVLLESEEYVSTFAYFASMNGNATLAALRRRGQPRQCVLRIDHKGRRLR